MSLRNLITEKLILPVADVAVGHNISKQLSFLKKSQWWSFNDLREYQNEQLRMLIRHAYENVPYYKEVMIDAKLMPNDIKSVDDLYKMPILTKEKFKENFPHKLTAQNLDKSKYFFAFTSGSTGKPIRLSITQKAYGFNMACNLRGWYWMGFRLGDKIIKISQNKRKSAIKIWQDKVNHTLLFPQTYTKESFYQFIKELEKYKPKFLRSYPDPLLFISSMTKNENIDLPETLKGINTTGNILFDNVRQLAENQFKTKITDSYSCEGNPNLFECNTHECYHSSMEYGIIEVLDKDGKEVGPGEQGRLYSTDLQNFASPFIRYDTQDVLEKSKNECSCGRKLIPINRIIGRDNDILRSIDGQYMIGQTFTTYFKYIHSITQFQIYQKKEDEFEFRFVTTDEYNDKLHEEILDHWQEKIGSNSTIEIRILDEIPLLVSGKRRFLIRDESIDLGL